MNAGEPKYIKVVTQHVYLGVIVSFGKFEAWEAISWKAEVSAQMFCHSPATTPTTLEMHSYTYIAARTRLFRIAYSRSLHPHDPTLQTSQNDCKVV